MATVFNRVGGGSEGEYPSVLFTSDSFTSSGSVTMTGQGKTYNGVWNGTGFLIENVEDYGTYSYSATQGSKTRTGTILIDAVEQFTIVVSFKIQIPVTITGAGNSSYSYVKYNGTKYKTATSFTYDDSIAISMECKGYRSYTYAYGVYLNGTRVATTTAYDYKPTDGTTSIAISLTATTQTSTGYTVRIVES